MTTSFVDTSWRSHHIAKNRTLRLVWVHMPQSTRCDRLWWEIKYVRPTAHQEVYQLQYSNSIENQICICTYRTSKKQTRRILKDDVQLKLLSLHFKSSTHSCHGVNNDAHTHVTRIILLLKQWIATKQYKVTVYCSLSRQKQCTHYSPTCPWDQPGTRKHPPHPPWQPALAPTDLSCIAHSLVNTK